MHSISRALIAYLPPLHSFFSHLILPPRPNSSLLSLTVFLSVSCLESQPVGQPRARKFVSSGAAERGGYLLRRVKSTGGHMGPFSHCGLVVVVSGTSSLERHPAWEHATGSSVWWRHLVWWSLSSKLSKGYIQILCLPEQTLTVKARVCICVFVKTCVATFMSRPLTLTLKNGLHPDTLIVVERSYVSKCSHTNICTYTRK